MTDTPRAVAPGEDGPSDDSAPSLRDMILKAKPCKHRHWLYDGQTYTCQQCGKSEPCPWGASDRVPVSGEPDEFHDELRAVLANATPEPWFLAREGKIIDTFGNEIATVAESSDAALIVNAPTWLAALLDEVRQSSTVAEPRSRPSTGEAVSDRERGRTVS